MGKAFRITQQRVDIVKEKVAKGEKLRDIAAYFDVPDDSIRQIITRFLNGKEKVREGIRCFRPFKTKTVEKICPATPYVKWPDPRFLSNGFCRAIIGDPRNMQCCGEKVALGCTYCKKHHDEYVKPYEARQA